MFLFRLWSEAVSSLLFKLMFEKAVMHHYDDNVPLNVHRDRVMLLAYITDEIHICRAVLEQTKQNDF